MEAEGIRPARRRRQLTIPGDGAAWSLEHRQQQFPEATQIADLYHAREHLHDLARLLEFMPGDGKDEWLAARTEDLDYGDIDGLWEAARACPLTGARKRRAGQGPGLLREQRAPHALQVVPLPRPVRRFRTSGSRWQGGHRAASQALRHALDLPGADAIIALRCREASSQMGSHLQQAPHPESNRLTARVQKIVMATWRN